MTARKITSLTLFLSFFFLIVTSIILYIVPQGRVAYWADWRLWGLSKTQWGDLHINLGFLFLLAGLLHIYYNWRPIVTYMKNRARKVTVLTPAFSIAFLLTLAVGVGTYFEIPPMSSVIQLGQSFKDAAAGKYGEPPYGHAELSSLKLFAKKQDIDLDQAVELLRKNKIVFSGVSETLADIAAGNNLTPRDIYALIKPAEIKDMNDTGSNFPDSPMPGFGNMTLKEICGKYKLDLVTLVKGLKGRGIESDGSMTVRQIGAANDKEPMAVFEVIHSLVK